MCPMVLVGGFRSFFLFFESPLFKGSGFEPRPHATHGRDRGAFLLTTSRPGAPFGEIRV